MSPKCTSWSLLPGPSQIGKVQVRGISKNIPTAVWREVHGVCPDRVARMRDAKDIRELQSGEERSAKFSAWGLFGVWDGGGGFVSKASGRWAGGDG